MSYVKYTGTADFQEFSSADFKKAGVEAKKVRFARNEPTEVDDSVAEALLSKEGIFGDHSFEEADAPDEEAPRRSSRKAADQELTDSGTVQNDTGDTEATPRTGGSRTRGAGSTR